MPDSKQQPGLKIDSPKAVIVKRYRRWKKVDRTHLPDTAEGVAKLEAKLGDKAPAQTDIVAPDQGSPEWIDKAWSHPERPAGWQ